MNASMKKRAFGKATALYSAAVAALMNLQMALALDIPTYTLNSQGTDQDPAALVIGISMYICRIIGAGLLIWGIVGFVTARKEGDAGALTSEIGKLVGGLILVFMPAVLTGLGIIG